MPRTEVFSAYSNADFSILIRDADQRYARAGFPTKFVESLCCSTPVICNLSSDLNKYVIDWNNAVILPNILPITIKKMLEKIVNTPREEIDAMKVNARITAENMFGYSLYSDQLISFIATDS